MVHRDIDTKIVKLPECYFERKFLDSKLRRLEEMI